jgi:hypothetical protein
VDDNKHTPPFAQDWAASLATNISLEVRQVIIAAITTAIVDTLGGVTLRNQIAHLLREELSTREYELAVQYHHSDD